MSAACVSAFHALSSSSSHSIRIPRVQALLTYPPIPFSMLDATAFSHLRPWSVRQLRSSMRPVTKPKTVRQMEHSPSTTAWTLTSAVRMVMEIGGSEVMSVMPLHGVIDDHKRRADVCKSTLPPRRTEVPPAPSLAWAIRGPDGLCLFHLTRLTLRQSAASARRHPS